MARSISRRPSVVSRTLIYMRGHAVRSSSRIAVVCLIACWLSDEVEARSVPLSNTSRSMNHHTKRSACGDPTRSASDDAARGAHGIALVHIGKCGGSTISGQLRRGCHAWWAEKYGCGHCPASWNSHWGWDKPVANETEISRQVTAYWHVHSVPVGRYAGFIVLVREPLERLISVFLAAWVNPHAPRSALGSGAKPNPARSAAEEFYRCFPTVNQLAEGTVSELASDTCAALGRRVIRGATGPQHGHFYWNFGFYAAPIVASGCPVNRTVYVLRTEALWHDWKAVNAMLGGGDVPAPTTHEKKGVTSKTAKLYGYNRTVSAVGTYNLCSLLAEEIRIYKQLLQCSANLDARDKMLEIMAIDTRCRIAPAMESGRG